jgi:hypothetical protein
MDDHAMNSLVINAVAGWAISKAKSSNSPWLQWLDASRPVLTTIVSTLVAAITAAGMTITWDGGSGTLTITGISVASVLTFVWFVVKNQVFQHITMTLMDIRKTQTNA